MLPRKIVAATASVGLLVLPIFAVAYNHDIAQAHAQPAAQHARMYQAKSDSAADASVRVGDTVNLEQVDIVEEPEVYGLGLSPAGNRYAIIDNLLVRLNPDTGKVLSILREIQ